MAKHELTKATDIPYKVRRELYKRDDCRCVLCGRYNDVEVAHYISRAQLGRGIVQNLVLLCKKCHMDYDGTKRKEIKPILAAYLSACYKHWDESKLTYNKYAWLEVDDETDRPAED